MINLLLFAGAALTLLMPDGFMVLGITFMLIGLWNTFTQNHCFLSLKNNSVYALTGGFWLYSLVGVFMTIYHGHAWTNYEMYLPAILYPLIFLAIPHSQLQPILFFFGAATGAIGAALIAFYQVKILGIGRADGFYFNAIHFGNTALVLGASSFIGLMRMPAPHHYYWPTKIWLALGGICGVLTSLLSGSKGGWLTLLLILLLVFFISTQNWQFKKKLSALILCIVLLIGGVTLLPKQTVVARIEDGFQGAKVWLATGQVTEGSVSVRLAAWKIGIEMFLDRPWIGWGAANMGPEQQRRLEQTGLAVNYINGLGAFENEYINSLVRFGVIGGISLMLAFGSPLIAFARYRKHKDPSIQSMAILGMLLPVMYMEFGLSVSILSVNTCRQVYFSWCIVLMSFILLKLNQLQATEESVKPI